MSEQAVFRAGPLDIARGDRVLLRALSLELYAGELVYLRGPNGSGKTSLLEVLAGLRRPEAGRVDEAERPPLHWIGHRNGLSGALSVRENLEDWARLAGADLSAVPAAIADLGLWHRRNRRVRQLSAGQARRAALCRLRLADRPLWLLDEPYAALDADGVERLNALIAAHCAAGGAVLLSSHQSVDVAGVPLRTLELGR